MTNELYHHGILGQKWGVRRYQNSDGSLTAKGKKRLEREAKEKNYVKDGEGNYRTSGKKSKIINPDADQWVKEDMTRSKRVSEEGTNLTRNTRNTVDSIDRIKRRNAPKMDLSNMTEKEMRDQINRALLEKQYDDMFNPKKQSKGRAAVADTLEIAGGVLAMTGSALGIAVAIKELKG